MISRLREWEGDMAITKIKFQNFMAFDKLEFLPSPGVNILIGANGTGKTHIMKVAYSACDITKSQKDFAEKLVNNFLPSNKAIGRLVQRKPGSRRANVEIHRGNFKLKISFSNHSKSTKSATITGNNEWMGKPLESVYIPVKEMLSNAPGFRSLYTQREIHFEEIYADIIDRAFRPLPRGGIDRERQRLLEIIQKIIEGIISLLSNLLITPFSPISSS